MEDNKVWRGAMSCDDCGYRWESRKNTSPVKCPRCASANISTVMENKSMFTGANKTFVIAGVVVMVVIFVLSVIK